MQFDLSEIAARKFRKELLENKEDLSPDNVNKINDEILTSFSEERLELVKGTNSGRNDEQIEVWKTRIAGELKALDDFRFENDRRIKLN